MMDDMDENSQHPRGKSLPSYAPLYADPRARKHLFIAEGSGLDAILRVLDTLDSSRVPTEVFWLGEGHEKLNGRVRLQAFSDQRQLIDVLLNRFAQSEIGVRLYFAGREAFIWEMSSIAHHAGLREDEIQREACGSRARNVFCVHCRQMLREITTDLTCCHNCGVLLEVRNHFSRRLAGYLGVCANAECPEETPECRELFA